MAEFAARMHGSKNHAFHSRVTCGFNSFRSIFKNDARGRIHSEQMSSFQKNLRVRFACDDIMSAYDRIKIVTNIQVVEHEVYIKRNGRRSDRHFDPGLISSFKKCE